MGQKTQGGGGGVVALILFAFVLSPGETSSARYHISRMLGAKPTPTRAIVEREIDRVADQYGIKRPLLRALIRVESGGNIHAQSRVGARGITQVMPANAQRCGLRHPDQLWDLVSNLRCGAQILREELDEHGDEAKALTVYNCGKVRCREGQQYAQKVLSLTKKG
jgi:soluble lytic murein transglycosylase-like protein